MEKDGKDATTKPPSPREGVLCITTVIPAKAGIQRGRATECKAKRQV